MGEEECEFGGVAGGGEVGVIDGGGGEGGVDRDRIYPD